MWVEDIMIICLKFALSLTSFTPGNQRFKKNGKPPFVRNTADENSSVSQTPVRPIFKKPICILI